jgi:hypothetical protein
MMRLILSLLLFANLVVGDFTEELPIIKASETSPSAESGNDESAEPVTDSQLFEQEQESEESQSEEPMEDSEFSRQRPEFHSLNKVDWSRVRMQYHIDHKLQRRKYYKIDRKMRRAAGKIVHFGNSFHEAFWGKARTQCKGNRRCSHSVHSVREYAYWARRVYDAPFFHRSKYARMIEAASRGFEKHIGAVWRHEAALCGRGRASCRHVRSLVRELKRFDHAMKEFVTLWREYVPLRNNYNLWSYAWSTGNSANQMVKVLKRCPRRECHDAQPAAYNLVRSAANFLRHKPLDKNVLIPQLKRDEQLVLKFSRLEKRFPLYHDRRDRRLRRGLKLFLWNLKKFQHFLSYY